MNFPPPSEKQARIIWTSLTMLAVGVLVALVVLLGWGSVQLLGFLSPVLWPIAVAAILAYLLDPLVDRLQRKMSRTKAILAVFATGVGIVCALVLSVTPRIVHEVNSFDAQQFQAKVMESVRKSSHFRLRTAQVVARLSPRLGELLAPSPPKAGTNTPAPTLGTNTPPAPPASASPAPPEANWEAKMAENITAWLGESLPKVGAWLLSQLSRVTSLLSVFVGLGLVPVYCFYFLQEKTGIQSSWTDYLPIHRAAAWRKEVVFVLTSINDYLITFFRGQILVAVCNGVMYVIGFSIVGLSFSLLLGLMAGALSLVPYLGFILTIVPALGLAAVQYGDWLHPILVASVFLFVQLTESLVISPKIMGDRVGLHPVTIIIAVMLGTTLMGGLLGGILAIPLTAALRVVMFRYVWGPPPPAEGT